MNGDSVDGGGVDGDSVDGDSVIGGWANRGRGNFHPRPGPPRSPRGSPGCRYPARKRAAHGPAAGDRHGVLGEGD